MLQRVAAKTGFPNIEGLETLGANQQREQQNREGRCNPAAVGDATTCDDRRGLAWCGFHGSASFLCEHSKNIKPVGLASSSQGLARVALG